MNATVSHFLEHLRQRNQQPELGRDFISWSGLMLRVHRSLDDEKPLHYELTWPLLSDPSVSIYPLLLCECVLGHEFHYPSFTERAANFIHLGSPYTERWQDREIHVHTENTNVLLRITSVAPENG
ncbi:MAG: hypothetical protein QM627_06015 [Luteolibacter sp.]